MGELYLDKHVAYIKSLDKVRIAQPSSDECLGFRVLSGVCVSGFLESFLFEEQQCWISRDGVGSWGSGEDFESEIQGSCVGELAFRKAKQVVGIIE